MSDDETKIGSGTRLAPLERRVRPDFEMTRFEIAKLTLKPGDILVCRFLTEEAAAENPDVAEFLEHLTEGMSVRIGVMGPNAELVVITV